MMLDTMTVVSLKNNIFFPLNQLLIESFFVQIILDKQKKTAGLN